MVRVVGVEALANYRIGVRFEDGVEGIVGLSDFVCKGVFAPLRDPQEFGRVFVDQVTRTVAWPGGIDLCPDALYADIKAQQEAA